MNILVLLVGIAAVAAVGVYAIDRRLSGMTTGQKKAFLKTSINNVYLWFEKKGLLKRTPAFNREYHRDYPKLKLLEDNYGDVRDECLHLLGIKDKLTDISAMGGAYTQAGIHVIKWKSFVFKSGKFIESNCRMAPKTAAILRQIPGVYTAFFSILEPHQYVTPHWGYYKGFLRYHLGVVIPNDNEDRKCYLRVNPDPKANVSRDEALKAEVEHGETYYWKNGEGMLFDDNYLHDAANDSDEIRVVLWLDMARKMPFYLDWFNRLCLAVVHRDESVRRIRENALIET